MQIRSLLIAIGAILLAICVFLVMSGGSALQQGEIERTQRTNAIPAAQRNASPVVESLLKNQQKITLAPQNNSGVSGLVLIEEVNNKVRIAITLTGSPVDASHPAHFHTGTCEVPGEIVYSLQNVIDGRSETDLDISMSDIQKQQPLIINIHESDEDIRTYVACGVAE